MRIGIVSSAFFFTVLNPRVSSAQMISPASGEARSGESSASRSGSASTTSTTNAVNPVDSEASWRKIPVWFLRHEKEGWVFPTNWQTASFRIPARENFAIATLPRATFERDAMGGDWASQAATGSSPQPQTQVQHHHGLVMRSVKRTLEDQKELYLTPFKPANFKWDALELGGTGALLATDRRIETHISTAHFTFYQATSDVAIAGLGATLSGVWAWGIKGDHPHAKETGVLELETLVNTFLIYTPMQYLAGRQRPGEGNGYGDFWKHHSINTSFPGGHAMFTFAMSTIVSHEYPQWWVQALAYGAATTVTVTRFMARDHWASDMFAGSALGIGIGAHIFHAHCDPELSDSCKHHTRWIF